MSLPVGMISSMSLSVFSAAMPLADPLVHLQWLHGWLPSLGLLAMGFRNLLGGGDDDPEATGVAGDDDFLDGGEFGSSYDPEADGLGDGLDDDDDDVLAEIEPRLGDLEADLDELSATVSSIHGEHESMRESVADIEDNVRKLLEVYEVVSQSANPFADSSPMGSSTDAGFGLLADDQAADESTSDEIDDLFDDAEAPETDDEPENDAEVADEAEGDGLSFDELKSGFEFDDAAAEEPTEEEIDVQPEVPTSETGSPVEPPADTSETTPTPPVSSGKPYLQRVPAGYAAELLLMEWLNFLVTESSLADAIRALGYYRSLEWLTDDVASHLQSILAGMTPDRELAAADGGRPAELSVEHHTRSLEFIAELRELGSRSTDRDGRAGHGLQR